MVLNTGTLADDVRNFKTDQIVPIKVQGDWSVMRNVHHMRFFVKNAADIAKKFHSFIDEQ